MDTNTTGFIYDETYLHHMLHEGHPESPGRLKAILKRLKDTGLDQEIYHIKPENEALKYIQQVHSDSHISRVEEMAFDPTICQLAVSGVLTAIDKVMNGTVKNAFCALRPPGHHATTGGEFGFCFYSNVAIGAKYAQSKYGLEKIMIVDWDFHHGNGTEWAFYSDPSVLFFSTHSLYSFPMTGFVERNGEGEGMGYNINVPLPSYASDKDILTAFETKLLPRAENFKPDLVFISAGFDSRKGDFLGDFEITDSGFINLTKMIKSLATTYSESRIISVLEGGYNPEGLALGVEAHIGALLE
ncbi:MAG: histone deacetylase [Bacteroidales bacterium]|nr:histone deacetylase [Bacteroidales bacterium]